MSAGPDGLTRLAELHGIESAYVDAYGVRRVASPETLRALLGAMGCAADSERAIDESIVEAEHRAWTEPLDPVVVRRAGESLAIPLGLPRAGADGRLRWRLVLESGEVRRGGISLARQPVAAENAIGGRGFVRRRLGLRVRPPVGEHRLEVEVRPDLGAPTVASTRLIVAPARCFSIEDLRKERLWGVTAQLYGLRSARDFGMGDFTDLGQLAEIAAGLGASAVGVNPLHALFPAEPRHISPYSPSSRLFLNVLYIDPEAVPELAECRAAQAMLSDRGFRRRIEASRAESYVDALAVAELKLPVFERLFADFRARHLEPGAETGRGGAYRGFVAEMGESLERQARFDALHEHLYRVEGEWSWRAWPEALRDPESAEVEAFAERYRERVEFFRYLQWLADEQLDGAQRRARRAGMPIGTYRDLAVAVHPDGAMAWANPGVTVIGASVGAPPDPFNAKGQNWGLAPLSPTGLRDRAYAPLAQDLRQNMRHAGALRIDHVMGLARLFWVPEGASPADGTYVRYPFDDLAGVVAMQSQRERCLVIGEDLGTVEPGFRERMLDRGILSYRVLWFERDPERGYLLPEHYPKRALLGISTHDLPTLAGFWTGRDLQWRRDLHLYPDAAAREAAERERVRERAQLIEALRRADLLPEDLDPEDDRALAALLRATCRFVAGARSALTMLQLEDALGEIEQANLPGTTDEHPNWRRRLPRALEDMTDDPTLKELAGILNRAGRHY